MPYQAEIATSEHADIGDNSRVLVLEPTDVLWLGVQQMLNLSGVKKTTLWRIRTPDELGAALRLHQPNALLLTSVGNGTAVLSLLKQLSTLLPLHPGVRVMAFLQQKTPYLPELLQGFGVDRMFTPENITTTLVNALRNCRKTGISRQPTRFTRRECSVTQELLAGHNVSHVARMMGKDIRTISAYKQSVLDKMKMIHGGELQVLGGNLMAAEVKQCEGRG